MGGTGSSVQTAREEGDTATLDQADFDAFYRREFGDLVAFATAVQGRRAGAEDLVQEAMLAAYSRWDRLGGYDSPRAWVRRVVLQRAMKAAKKQANERRAHERSRRPDDLTQDAPPLVDPALMAVLGALPTQQRAVLALHYLADHSVREIAESLGIAEGTVKAHLFKGRLRLATTLESDDPDRSAPND